MNLGFSFGTAPVQAVTATQTEANIQAAFSSPDALLQKTALVAAQLGTTVSFFTQINTNRQYVSRGALPMPSSKDDETFDQKRTKNIIRKLKTEKTEPSNDQRPQ